jgi:hypothetical protein
MPEKSVAEKMFIRPNARCHFYNPPPGVEEMLGPLPAGAVQVEASPKSPADLILAFVANQAELEAALPILTPKLAPGGALWICYHKGTSTIKTDINRDTIWKYAESYGLKPNRQIAIDADWSALRFTAAA